MYLLCLDPSVSPYPPLHRRRQLELRLLSPDEATLSCSWPANTTSSLPAQHTQSSSTSSLPSSSSLSSSLPPSLGLSLLPEHQPASSPPPPAAPALPAAGTGISSAQKAHTDGGERASALHPAGRRLRRRTRTPCGFERGGL